MKNNVKRLKNKVPRLLLMLGLILMNIGCDQASKNIVRKQVGLYENISLIKDHLTLTKVENTGAFLSLGEELPDMLRFSLLSLMPVAVLAFGLYYLFSHPRLPLLLQMALCFLIGGGIGNIYDRLRFGAVTDFLHADFGLFRTGVFNFADISILIGVSMLLMFNLRKKKEVPFTENKGME
ncbi:Lipoprotein signal peptidase [compost metagenome]